MYRDKGSTSPIAALVSAWRHRDLILVIAQQELKVRFRDSIFGWIWAAAAPLIMLGLFTLMFKGAMKIQVESNAAPWGIYASLIFPGLVVFNLFVELATRSPMLLHENARSIKRSVFPSEMLVWIALIRALANAGIAMGVLFAFTVIVLGRLPLTNLLLPFIIVPYCLGLVGMSWFFAALGGFTRDVGHLMVALVPVLILITPVFYMIPDLPADLQPWIYLNPLAGVINVMRTLIVVGELPNPWVYLWVWVVSLTLFWLGYVVYMRYRRILVDVI